MKGNFFILTFLFIRAWAFGQSPNFQGSVKVNKTNKAIKLIAVTYSPDSLVEQRSTYLKKGESNYFYEAYYIRIDYFCLDRKYGDTISSVSVYPLSSQEDTFELYNGSLEASAPWVISPKLRIQGRKLFACISVTDTVEFQTSSKDIVRGMVKSFDNTSILLLTDNGSTQRIDFESIEQMRICNAKLAFLGFSFFYKCRLTKLKKVNFEIVKREYSKLKKDIIWKEVN